jgi:hypothetical protein
MRHPLDFQKVEQGQAAHSRMQLLSTPQCFCFYSDY